MKKISFLLLIALLIAGCSAKKAINEKIASGDYDAAIDMAIEKIKKKRNTRKADDYVLLLEEAYNKAQQRDLKRIERLKKDNNPEKWQEIFKLYTAIMSRQDKVEPLLPLHIYSQNRDARLEIRDYTDQMLEARNKMVARNYEKARRLMQYGDRAHYREAYDLLEEIDRVYPNYKDTRRLMEEAHARGVARVGVIIENKTDKVIPKKLEEQLLDFSSVNANNFWTEYEPVDRDTASFDYLVKLIFTDIEISPEKEQEKIIDRERTVKVGTEYVRDQNGNIVKDSLGNPIKRDVYKTVRARVHEYRQFKEAHIRALMEIYDMYNRKKIHTEPIASDFVFENIYLKVDGDKRALDDELAQFINNVKVPFPTDEQMLMDAGSDLKTKFEDILYHSEFP